MIIAYIIIGILLTLLILIGLYRLYELLIARKEIYDIKDVYITKLLEKEIPEKTIISHLKLRYSIQILFGLFLSAGILLLKEGFLPFILPVSIIIMVVVKITELAVS